MSIQFRCRSEKRYQTLRDTGLSLNGIDYLEVGLPEAHTLPPEMQQCTLQVRMLKPEPWGLADGNVQIEGGVRVVGVGIRWVLRASEAAAALAAGLITEDERDALLALAEPDHVLVVRTDVAGDFSPYQLRLVTSTTNPEPPLGFDPILSEVTFSFKVDCPSQFDCRAEELCPPEEEETPVIDYLARDYASFRRLMLDRLAVIMPDWQERSPADLGIALVEVLAYAADYLSYYQDAVATEAYLGTARRRGSMRRHARLLDYAMHDGCNARTWVHFTAGSSSVLLPQGTPLLTAVTGYGTRIDPDRPDTSQALAQGPVVFETMHAAELDQALNRLELYTWGEPECCLPQGATTATLAGDLSGKLAAGDVLVFLEARGPQSGKAADADPSHRHAVRLTRVRAREDALGGQFLDPPSGDPVPVTDIQWMAADALPFPLCVNLVEVPAEELEEGDAAMQPVSVALGNIVLADHGRTIEDEALAPVPEAGRYYPRLERSEITYCSGCQRDAERASSADVYRQLAASQLLAQDPRAALPAGTLTGDDATWSPQRDLLASDRFAAEFVVEMGEDGRASLRFGDGVFGRRPAAGADLRATYRVGNGRSGNVGAGALAHMVTDVGGIDALTNPLPALGGIDPESIEEVRQYAPQAFRTQERAVTEADYAEVAQRHPQVQRAEATRRWTGSWHTMFLTIDRAGGLPVDDEFEAEMRQFLERYRLSGQDLEIDGPHFVPLDIAFMVCVEAGYFRSDVQEALLEVFSNRALPDGRRGFFHPDNFTFGQQVYLSRFVATAMQVPGVRWVNTDHGPGSPNRFQRWGEPPHDEFSLGWIDIGRLEIARLDNDPSAPENGKIEFFMEGGL